MDNPTISQFLKRYRDKSGVLDLDKMLQHADALKIRTVSFSHGVKKLSKLIFPDGMRFYVKPTSYRGASAERIVAEIYQKSGIVAPETTIATLNGNYYAITNDVFSTNNTEQGELFLRKIMPGGAQYALPSIFGKGEINQRVLSYFEPKVLKQIAEHYGLALATKNWDANLGGLGFYLTKENCAHADSLIALDFEQSLERECRGGYANPFSSHRLSALKLLECLKYSDKDFIQKDEIAQKIFAGVAQIDEIVRKCKDEGFQPSENYVNELKFSMHDISTTLQR